MNKLLVKYEGNWADEIYVKGFRIFTQEEWDKFINAMPEKSTFGFSVGSNQSIDYDGRQDFLRDVEVKEISDEDAEAVIRALGLSEYFPQYGKFPEFYFDEEDDE